ncbi:MAG: CBS domain-containing protein [Steroidobacteraceae bacterium]|jgi:CBS domain protein
MANSTLSAMGPNSPLIEASRTPSDVDLDPDNWAYQAVTDFTRICPITVFPDCPIEDARERMIGLGVHALLVTDRQNDGERRQVLGLITSYDIQHRQERMHQMVQGLRLPPKAVCVREVMTPWNDLPLIHYESLLDLTVGELQERLEGTGLTHFLVVESEDGDSGSARGLISRASIAKRLRRAPST